MEPYDGTKRFFPKEGNIFGRLDRFLWTEWPVVWCLTWFLGPLDWLFDSFVRRPRVWVLLAVGLALGAGIQVIWLGAALYIILGILAIGALARASTQIFAQPTPPELDFDSASDEEMLSYKPREGFGRGDLAMVLLGVLASAISGWLILR